MNNLISFSRRLLGALKLTPIFAAVVFAVAVSLLGAVWVVGFIEARSERAAQRALLLPGLEWAALRVDGLQVILGGTAPDEQARFAALRALGQTLEARRVIDQVTVAEPRAITPPRLSLEILRNGRGLSLLGLVPGVTARDDIVARLAPFATSEDGPADLLLVAQTTPPDGWADALEFGLKAVADLPRSRVRISPNQVEIDAVLPDQAARDARMAQLLAAAPASVVRRLNLTAPRSVISPFSLRFVKDASGARFDACAADSEAARVRILAAARAAGAVGGLECALGLGAPSPAWADAVSLAMGALAQIGGGTLTLHDADITLVAGPQADPDAFARSAKDLTARLPVGFSLHAVLPELAPVEAAASGFLAERLADQGSAPAVRLAGPVPSVLIRDAVVGYGRAAFPGQSLETDLRVDPTLPEGWPMRVLTGLQALSLLHEGRLQIGVQTLSLSGTATSPKTRAEIVGVLSGALGQAGDFALDIAYDKALDPDSGLPTPRECGDQIDAVIARQNIRFAPGKAEFEPDAAALLREISKILARCGALPFEVGGHTDSQGSEDMNRALSQDRAEAVIAALADLGAPVAGLRARGYGESRPRADNATEAGREANRRISFTLTLSPDAASRVARETVLADAALMAPLAHGPVPVPQMFAPKAAIGLPEGRVFLEPPAGLKPSRPRPNRPK